MTKFQIENKILKLHVEAPKAIYRYLMFFFAFISFIVPLIAFVTALWTGKFHAGIFISFLFFGFIGYYLLRSALWNTYGTEEFHFDVENIIYITDYKKFKEKVRTIPRQNIQVDFVPCRREKDKYVLQINHGKERIKSVIGLSESEKNELFERIKQELLA